MFTEQHAFRAHQMDKVEMVARVLQAEGRGLTMVFCRTKRVADQLAGALTTRGFAAAAVHGDLGQGEWERAMRAFRNGKIDVLVATDVASRGLDVDDVTHVIDYECPEDDKAYLHRTGRTGRAGRDGIAVTFVDWRDMPRWKLINESLGMGIPEPVETYSTSAHLFEELDIPAGVKGSLPRGSSGDGPDSRRKSSRTWARPGRPAHPSARRAAATRAPARTRRRARPAGPQAHPGRGHGQRRGRAQPRPPAPPSPSGSAGSARASQAGPATGEGSAEPSQPRLCCGVPAAAGRTAQLAKLGVFRPTSRNRRGWVRRRRSIPG